MTTLLEFKQKIKYFFGELENYFLPLIKFAVAFYMFRWINRNMGYMPQLDNTYILLVVSLICCILPSQITAFAACMMVIMHGYALGLEVAGFLAVLMLLMVIFFLRYSAGTGIIFMLTPISLSFGFPVMLPIASGLLLPAASAIPAGCGVVLYYLIRYIQTQASALSNPDVEMIGKLKMMADGIIVNWGMWITVIAFIFVILLVHLIRTRSFDYSWRVAIVSGGLAYVLVMLTGSYYLSATIDVGYLVVSTCLAVVVGLIIDFFFFGGDYSRTEHLQYEDDEYYYYVKAVPKAAVSTSKRYVKRINDVPYAHRDTSGGQEAYGEYGNDDLSEKLVESLREL